VSTAADMSAAMTSTTIGPNPSPDEGRTKSIGPW
jgi:hypothetical protein